MVPLEGEIFQPAKSVKFCMSSRKRVERVGVSVKSRRLGSRIDRGEKWTQGHADIFEDKTMV